MPNEIEKIFSLEKFLNYLDNNFGGGLLLYRGQREDKTLLPKIARYSLEYNIGSKILNIENAMFEEFKKRYLPYADIIPDNDWDKLALAQHYGMPTRLLDWTDNPLAGLWFATQKPPVDRRTNGVLWVFEVPKQDILEIKESSAPFHVERTKVFRPNHITRRITAQGGWFTVHKYIDEKKKFISFEKNILYKDLLTKLIIPPYVFKKLKHQLNLLGVNSSSLFPELTGLCEHIEWFHIHKKFGSKDMKHVIMLNTLRPGNRRI